MKILHTADWHLGRTLYGRKRNHEFEEFLFWLIETIESETIDCLLVAGDIFDTRTPSNFSQTQYYQFLSQVSNSCCRHIVVIAGNHDSPSFLDASKQILKSLNVHVVGGVTDDPVAEVVVLNDVDSEPELIVCAVPYLRDKDIRKVAPGETIDDKNKKLIDGVRDHYFRVGRVAERMQAEFLESSGKRVSIFGMGHLFTAGGQTVEGDGVRDLYVGDLAHVGPEVFPSSMDYLALGHLHVPQKVGGFDHIRYSGSPIPMGYGEASQTKQVVIIELIDEKLSILETVVPCFQLLVRIEGALDEIHTSIAKLKLENSEAWLEIEYTGREVIPDLRIMIDEQIENSDLEVRRIKNRRFKDRIIDANAEDETLDELTPLDVFEKCLDSFEIPSEERSELKTTFQEVLYEIEQGDDLERGAEQ